MCCKKYPHQCSCHCCCNKPKDRGRKTEISLPDILREHKEALRRNNMLPPGSVPPKSYPHERRKGVEIIGEGLVYDSDKKRFVNTKSESKTSPKYCYYALLNEETNVILIYRDNSSRPMDWFKSRDEVLAKRKKEKSIQDIPAFFDQIKPHIPFALVTSGRSISLDGEYGEDYILVHLGTLQI